MHCSSAHSQWKRVSLELVKCQTLRMQRACLPQDYIALSFAKHIHIISISRMLAHERSTPLISTSSSSTSPSCTTSQYTPPINKHCADPQNEEYGSVAKTNSSTSYEPNVIDNFDFSETYTAIFQNESVDIDTEPSYSFDAEVDDELIRKASLRSEKNQRT